MRLTASHRLCEPAVHEGRGKGDREAGSALMLVPAGFLVLMLLAALTVDSAAAYLGQRQLSDAIAAAANDAATAGLDNSAFYQHGAVTLDPATTVVAVCQSMAAQGDSGLHDVRLAVGVSGAEVEITATANVRAVFGAFVPGFASRPVAAEVTADAQQGPASVNVRAPVLEPITC
jgi:hypothetical protein